MNRALLSSATDEWSTPQELFDELDARWRFTVDVCATAENAKCRRFFDRAADGLAQRWDGERCWMNPPYGREIGRWVAKARESALRGAVVVCLLPARTDTRWWHECVCAPLGALDATGYDPDTCTLRLIGSLGTTEIRLLRGRLRFGAARAGAPFPSAIVAFVGQAQIEGVG